MSFSHGVVNYLDHLDHADKAAGARVSVIQVPAGSPAHLDRCRHCGEPIDWRRAGPRAFADGSGAHGACHEADALRRAELARTTDAEADEAEVTLRGEHTAPPDTPRPEGPAPMPDEPTATADLRDTLRQCMEGMREEEAMARRKWGRPAPDVVSPISPGACLWVLWESPGHGAGPIREWTEVPLLRLTPKRVFISRNGWRGPAWRERDPDYERKQLALDQAELEATGSAWRDYHWYYTDAGKAAEEARHAERCALQVEAVAASEACRLAELTPATANAIADAATQRGKLP